MTTSVVVYSGNLRTESQHLKSGETITTDAPIDNKGTGQAFSPTDLAATSLANCMMTVMGIIIGLKLKRKEINPKKEVNILRVNVK